MYGRYNATWAPALAISGGTLTGALTLAADPTAPLQAATKQFVLPLAGGTLTGPLLLAADPTAALGAATKGYVDTHAGAGGIIDAPSDGSFYGRLNALWAKGLPLAGGTLTGPLVLAGDPTASLQAATKNYVDTNKPTVPVLNNFVSGLTQSMDATLPNTVMDFAIGMAADSTNTSYLQTLTAWTKSISSTWIAGTGNGGLASGISLLAATWYYPFIIMVSGAIDFYFDNTPLATHKPTGTTAWRRLRPFRTDASVHITPFVQHDDRIYYKTPIQELSSVGISSTVSSIILSSVPLGIITRPIMNMFVSCTSGATGAVRLYSPDLPDNNVAGCYTIGEGVAAMTSGSAYHRVDSEYVDSNQTFRAWTNLGSITITIFVAGWIDTLGR
jgi:hypothetical protein